MFLTGLGTAVPPQRYSQKDCWEALSSSGALDHLKNRSRLLLERVLLGDSGIESRHLGVDRIADALDLSPDAMLGRFRTAAPSLGEKAARLALDRARLSASDIGAIVVATCTGYLCPGLTSYIAEKLALRPDVIALDLVGLGCGAAVPAIRSAGAFVQTGRVRHALVICVEISTAAVYLDDDFGVLISACLFGDGAAATVLSAAPGPGRPVRWLTDQSLLKPHDRDELRFDHRQGLLRNILSRDVPRLAAAAAREVFDNIAARENIGRDDIAEWLWHGGGREVLRAISTGFSLTDDHCRHSAAVLRSHGNMSSPSCLFALDRALAEGARGGLWWLGTFGAGFSSHAALLLADPP